MTSSALDLLILAIQSHPRYLRSALRGFSEGERQTLFFQLSPAVHALEQSCAYSDKAMRSQKDGARFGAQVARVGDIAAAMQQHWPQIDSYLKREEICLYAAEDAGLFYLKLQMFKVALSPQDIAETAFLYQDDALPFIWSQHVEESWLYNLGLSLIHRPEEWRISSLQKVLTQLEHMPSPLGYARLMLSLYKQFPQISEQLTDHWGQAMYLDGFRESDLSEYPPVALFAGLSYESPEWQSLSHYQLPLSSAETALYSRLEADDIPRHQWRQLLLERLFRAPKPSRARLWVRAWEAEQLGVDLEGEYLEQWLKLLYAPTAPAVRLAVNHLKPLIHSTDISLELLLKAILHALNHPVQMAAQGAWSLFKLVYRHYAPEQTQILTALAPHLALPHENLRQDILRWLSKLEQYPQALQKELKWLQETHLLSPLELEFLGAGPYQSQRDLVLELDNFELDKVPPVFQRAVQQWLQPGPESPLELAPATLSDSEPLAPEALESWQAVSSPQSLAERFLLVLEGPNPFLLECLMRDVLRFPCPTDLRVNIRQELKPLLGLMRAWQRGLVATRHYPQPKFTYPLVVLAHGWVNHSAELPGLSAVSQIYCQSQIADPVSYFILRQVYNTLQALVDRLPLLSTPDSPQGWIHNRNFAHRLRLRQVKAQSSYDEQDLGLALLRLLHDEDIWSEIAGFCLPCQSDWQAACIIACGPLALARETLKKWVKSLNDNPPDDWFIQVRFQALQPRDTLNNRRFQLLNRAVLSRCACDDARVQFPDLLRLKLDHLQINQGVDYSRHQHLTETLTRGLESLLNGEELNLWELLNAEEIQQRHETLSLKQHPAQRSLEHACWNPGAELTPPFQDEMQLERNLDPMPLPYPQLVPQILSWLGEHYQPGYGSEFQLYEEVHPMYFYFPALRPLLWKIAIQQLKKNQHHTRHAFVFGLLQLGFSADIPLSPQDLEPLMKVLESKHAEHRHKVLDILHRGLLDGRLSANALIQHWSMALKQSSHPAFIQSLESWFKTSPASELIGMVALEQRWLHSPPLPTRALHRLLKLYLEHLRFYPNWKVHDPELLERFSHWTQQHRNRKLSETAALILKYLNSGKPKSDFDKMLRAALVQSAQSNGYTRSSSAQVLSSGSI